MRPTKEDIYISRAYVVSNRSNSVANFFIKNRLSFISRTIHRFLRIIAEKLAH